MPTITIHHNANIFQWPTPNAIFQPRSLVLGSFNPHNPNRENVDYYYGRPTNHFWKSVAQIRGLPDNTFLGIGTLPIKLSIMHKQFCCLDIIDSIKLTCDDGNVLNHFIQTKIFSGFNDSIIFRNQTQHLGTIIYINRIYNNSILNTLNTSPTIDSIIHTMGTKRLWGKPGVWNWRNPSPADLNNFMTPIKNMNNIKFINLSFSPSGYAINNGSTPLQSLNTWMQKYLHL